MYKIVIYKTLYGFEPVSDHLRSISVSEDKDSRIRMNKIRDYIKILEEKGTFAGRPYVRHVRREIWELRPLNERILFAVCKEKTIVLLHAFKKKTKKTPAKELFKAESEFNDFKRRSGYE